MVDVRPTRPRCLVLGGTGYVGSAVCRRLHEDGARIAFTWRSNEDGARALAEELGDCLPLRVDLAGFEATREAVACAIEWLGGLDALVQCAGTAGNPALYDRNQGGSRDKFLKIAEADWREMLDVTVQSTFVACQTAAAALAEGGGNVVVVGSIDGVKPVPAPIHYAAAKGALRAMTEALAKELGRDDVRVNFVAVGMLEGGIGVYLSKELTDAYLTHCSLKRLGTNREVAELVAELAIENTYVTGQAILLDGGL